jgi:hypothetical protein
MDAGNQVKILVNLVTSNPIKKRIFELERNIHVGSENSIIEIGWM